MAKTTRAYTQPKAKPGRKVKHTQQSLTLKLLELKAKARARKLVDGMNTTAIKKKNSNSGKGRQHCFR